MNVGTFGTININWCHFRPSRSTLTRTSVYWEVLGSRGWAFDWYKFQRPKTHLTPKIGDLENSPLNFELLFLRLPYYHRVRRSFVSTISCNLYYVLGQVSVIGGVPVMLKTSDMSNTIPDEKTVVTYLSYLCVRLFEVRNETHAAWLIQTAWRRFQRNRRNEKKLVSSEAKAEHMVPYNLHVLFQNFSHFLFALYWFDPQSVLIIIGRNVARGHCSIKCLVKG